MEILTTWLDLISGIFIAADFFLPNNLGERIGSKLVNKFPSTLDIKNPLSRKTIVFNTIMTFFVMLLVVLWAMAKDPADYTTKERWTAFGLFSIGILIGSILITFIYFMLRKIADFVRWSIKQITQSESNPTDNLLELNILWIASFFIMYIALTLFSGLSSNYVVVIMTPASTFILSVMILPMFMISAPTIRSFLDSTPDKRVYIIARIGVILFVSAKLMTLTANI